MKYARSEECVYIIGQLTRESDACIEQENFEELRNLPWWCKTRFLTSSVRAPQQCESTR